MNSTNFRCPLCGNSAFHLRRRGSTISLELKTESYRLGVPSEVVAQCVGCDFCGDLTDIARDVISNKLTKRKSPTPIGSDSTGVNAAEPRFKRVGAL